MALNFRWLPIALAVVCIGANASLAKVKLVDPRQLLAGPDIGRPRFNSKPARELMSEQEYRLYTQALQRLDIATANKVLNTAFIREYPQFERARLKPDCLQHRGCRYWVIYASSNFDELGYSRALLELKTTTSELKKNGIAPPKFALKPWPQKTKYNSQLVYRRDEALGLLISQAEANYRPALIKLAILVRRAEIFNATTDVEYYILKRACLAGGDCKSLAPRLEHLRRSIAPDRVAIIDAKAREKNPAPPQLHGILLGEKF